MLYAPREHVPEYAYIHMYYLHILGRNLKRLLELADSVADSRYKLCDDFLRVDGRRLGKYLDTTPGDDSWV
ncbi:hypothetical protein BDR07DRAFT_503770 [Suillus spraguei]|nr:hypothetical protein BDR07DRAFT_503770 [Suillus spraguei]